MHRRRQSGFTLIELMVSFAIIMVIIGVGAYGARAWSEEQKFNRPIDELKTMAKKAWHRAIAEHSNWEIVIRPRSLELRPKEGKTEEARDVRREADKQLGLTSGVEFFQLPEDMQVAVRHFGEDKWAVPRPDFWVFQHSGLCEPMMFRFERGERWLEMRFDPLTASVQWQDAD